MDCIFCKIANSEIQVEKIYSDDKVIAFNDINPVAPVHILIIPKEHIPSATDLIDVQFDIVAHIFRVIKKLAQDYGLSEKGFRIVNNVGEDGGQSVNHLHFHLIGGRRMDWPPG